MRSFFYAKEVHTMPNYDEMDDIYGIFGLGGDISIDRESRDSEDDEY